jgi:hypothetical protein
MPGIPMPVSHRPLKPPVHPQLDCRAPSSRLLRATGKIIPINNPKSKIASQKFSTLSWKRIHPRPILLVSLSGFIKEVFILATNRSIIISQSKY